MMKNTIKNEPFPDNVSDDGVSYAPQSWSERQAAIEEAQKDSQIGGLMNMFLSILK